MRPALRAPYTLLVALALAEPADPRAATFAWDCNIEGAPARYAFTGENQFADFIDLNTNDRFHVQFITQGRELLMIANPHGTVAGWQDPPSRATASAW